MLQVSDKAIDIEIGHVLTPLVILHLVLAGGQLDLTARTIFLSMMTQAFSRAI